MKSPIQRRVAIASLLLAPVLGACGFSAQTDQVYQAAVGVDERSSDVDVLNAVIVTNGTGQGTFAGTLVNNTGTADALENVTAEGATLVPGGEIAVPAYGLVNLSELLENGKIALTLDGDAVAAGGYVTLTFTFTNAEPVTVITPVVDNTGKDQDYAGVPLPPAVGGAAEDEESGESGEDHADESDTEH